MKVFYTDTHRLHDAPYEVGEGGQQEPMLEGPDRLDKILAALQQTPWANIQPPTDFGLDPIRAVHDPAYLEFLRTSFSNWKTQGGQLGVEKAGPVLLPSTFPPRRSRYNTQIAAGQAGYYIFDLSTPILEHTYEAILGSANCALSAAQAITQTERAAFGLCRPPGHHAGRDFAGGYCYLNNAAIAAQYLIKKGRVALLDVDYHGGNGTQDIFYESDQVLSISIHADPAQQYPYFVGYADETGAGPGLGFHRNFPLPPNTTDEQYLQTLDSALDLIRQFDPQSLVLSIGMDIYMDDPLGDFGITTAGIHQIGQHIQALGLPTAIIMEGGYNNEALGTNVVALVSAFA